MIFEKPAATFGLSALILVGSACVLYRPEPLEVDPPRSAPPPIVDPARAPVPEGPSPEGDLEERVEPPPSPRRPLAPVATLLNGETISEFAARIYGSAAAVEIVWAANRDRLPADVIDPETELPAGTLLRCPDPPDPDSRPSGR